MFNQFTGVGRLSADPETRFTTSGKQVTSFTVCCDAGYGDNKHTEFVKAITWEKTAKVASDYLHKGSMCMIQGEMKTRAWEDKENNKRYTTEINVQTVKLLSPKSSDQSESQGQQDSDYTPSPSDYANDTTPF